jgi:hypothetical protein
MFLKIGLNWNICLTGAYPLTKSKMVFLIYNLLSNFFSFAKDYKFLKMKLSMFNLMFFVYFRESFMIALLLIILIIYKIFINNIPIV